MLRIMPEFADMNDGEIVRQSRRGGKPSSRSKSTGRPAGRGETGEASTSNFSSEWIPNEAVRAINRIKAEFKQQMTETCVS